MPKNCKFENCKFKILSIGISCPKCNKSFCGLHRLPEDHQCPFLQEIKDEAFQKNNEKLINNKCVAAKI